jgi:hypothetical protein
VGAIALSIEVPLVFGRQDPCPLCAHKVYFKAQSCSQSPNLPRSSRPIGRADRQESNPAMSSAPRSREWAGSALALAAAIAFALANTSASLAYHGGSNSLTVAAMRFVLPTAVLVVWLRMRGVPLGLPGRDGWVAAALGAVTAIYTWALQSAIEAIPLGARPDRHRGRAFVAR